MLCSPRGHDDDRRADPLVPRVLDQLPAVGPREHEVDDADVGPLEPQSCEAGGAVLHADGIKARLCEVPRHAVGDDGVVFDDQDLRHTRES